MESVCEPARPGHVIMNKRSFESLVGLCERFHGRTSVVDSEEMQVALSEMHDSDGSCKRLSGDARVKYWVVLG